MTVFSGFYGENMDKACSFGALLPREKDVSEVENKRHS